MTQSGFKPVGQTEQHLFGPRKIIVCGYTYEHQHSLRETLAQLPEFKDLPILFARPEDEGISLSTLFSREPVTGEDETLASPPTVIMAGLTGKELHLLMSEHKKTNIPSPIWATLTPISAGWPLRKLLKELGREKEAMQKLHAQKA